MTPYLIMGFLLSSPHSMALLGENHNGIGEETVVWRMFAPEFGDCTVGETEEQFPLVKMIKH